MPQNSPYTRAELAANQFLAVHISKTLNPKKASSHNPGRRYVCWTLSCCNGHLQRLFRTMPNSLLAVFIVMGVAGEGQGWKENPHLT